MQATRENKGMNFFVCFTPLHVLLAQRITEHEAASIDNFLYISESTSDKNKRYFSLLETDSLWSHYFVKRGVVQNIFSVLRLFFLLRRKKKSIDTFYVTNIKTIYSRIFIWYLNPQQIVTFDDGIGNIDVRMEGVARSYFANTDENKWARLFFQTVDKRMLYKNLVEQINKHYTIYKLPNIFKNAEYLEIFTPPEKAHSATRPLTLLLTSALALENYMSAEEEEKFYDTLIEHYKVDLIIRHPRNESYVPVARCRVSDSLNIAEHQILELASQYDLFVVSVFYSSVLLNIPSEIKKINIITINPKKDHPELRKLHDFLNIPTVDFDIRIPH